MNDPPDWELSKGGATGDKLMADVHGLKNPRICRSRSCYPPLTKRPSSEEGELCYSGGSAAVAEGTIDAKVDPPSLSFTTQFKLLGSGIGLAEGQL